MSAIVDTCVPEYLSAMCPPHSSQLYSMNRLRSLAAQVVILLSFLYEGSLQSCQVSVSTPWEPTTHLPRLSSVIMSCTGEKSRNLEWYITLPGDNTLQFYYEIAIEKLNNHTFYEIPEIENNLDKTIQLLINSTEGKNGTVIECVDVGLSLTINKTVIIIDESVSMPNVSLRLDLGLQLINISWSPLLLNEPYTLTIISENTRPQLHESLQSSFLFTAPDDAPPCEVYNFTATFDSVGANVGVGCSVVLSRMLPSLPNKQGLEFSLNYSTEREDANTVSIVVSIKDALSYYCEDYPVTNYTVVVEKSFNSSETLSLFLPPNETYISISNLSENTVYYIRVLAWNAFGSTSTDSKEIYTTDVQLVSAMELRDVSAFRVRCDFMAGSTAQGCVVVLVGELQGNVTVNFMRGTAIDEVINTVHPTSCYNRVVAYDIESDGSVGDLAVPGRILADTTSNSVTTCLQQQKAPFPLLQIVLIVISVTLVMTICIVICLTIIILLCKLRKRSQFKTTVKINSEDRLPPVSVVAPPGLLHCTQEQDVPLYELPNNLSPDEKNGDVCKSASEDPSYNVLMHQYEESVPSNLDHDFPAYAMLQEEHVYHVLENEKNQQKPRVVHSTCSNNYDTPDFIPDKLPAEEFPIYQEVSELCVKNPRSLAVS